MEKQVDKLINSFIVIFIIIIALFTILTYPSSPILSIAHIVIGIIMAFVFNVQKKTFKHTVNEYVKQKFYSVESKAKSSFKTFPISILIINKEDGVIVWCNEEFADEFSEEISISSDTLSKKIDDILPELSFDKIKNYYTKFPMEVSINETIYRVFCREDSEENDDIDYLCLYFIDVTDDYNAREMFSLSKTVVSIISIDNYDELLRNTTDTEKSLIVAAINTKLNAWTKETNGIFRKYDRDRYLFMFANSHINEFTSKKFPVLDSIREIQTTEGITATLSIGIGKDGENLNENYEFALNALDMALSRGGDQAVVKNKYSFDFYGGVSKEVEKRTKVKSRVVANSLNQIIKDSSNVYIMGHSFSDFDSVGAAIGMCAAVRNNEKDVKIVIDLKKTSATPLISKILKNDFYRDIFISPDEALIKLTKDTLLIIVDTNNPEYVESPQVLDSAVNVVVIDHHRRAATYIENSTVNMHEPYASSTCEIVTELLQYMLNAKKISKSEAEALLCGIILDTKMFSTKTGSRTFEAAAYLRRIGADIDNVKALFKSDINTYLLKNKITSSASIFNEKFIISVISDDITRSLAAQCADELLNISDINASFVIFKHDNQTNISARSNSSVNVQVIMESLGGGGSLSAAACQFDSDTTENVLRLLKDAIINYDNFEKHNDTEDLK